jgi:hypothetical protein
MQRIIHHLLSGLLTAGIAAAAWAQTGTAPTAPADQTTTGKAAAAKATGKTDAKVTGKADAKAAKTATPAGKTTTKTAPKKEKEEAEPKIAGTIINRANGSFLGLSLENNTFKLSFYDAKKKPMAVDVPLATVRWKVQYQRNDELAVLNRGGDGKALVGAKIVRPPHAFRLRLNLLSGEGDDAKVVEYFDVDFKA